MSDEFNKWANQGRKRSAMSDARGRLIEAGERVLDRYPSGGLLARLLLDCWTSEEHAADLRAVTPKGRWGEWNRGLCDATVACPTRETLIANGDGWTKRCLAAEAERDALREERDEAVALLRETLDAHGVIKAAYTLGRTHMTARHERAVDALGRARAFLARIEGSYK